MQKTEEQDRETEQQTNQAQEETNPTREYESAVDQAIQAPFMEDSRDT
jgi:hypothetical protein